MVALPGSQTRHLRPLLLLQLLATALGAPTLRLEPRKFTPLPTGTVTPGGWLLTQLTLQAEGLSGHLANFWPDIAKSVWIGGGGDGGLHERTPYWLNGIVPLAFLLKNANITRIHSVSGIWKAPSENSAVALNASRTTDSPVQCGTRLSATISPLLDSSIVAGHGSAAPPAMYATDVDLLGQVTCYIDYIISQQAPDGWLGPADKNDAQAVWGRSNIMLALSQYAEAVPAAFPRVTSAMLRYAMALRARIATLPLAGWAAQRWQDLALGVQWLIDKAPQGHEAALIDLAFTLHSQGVDWEGWFERGTWVNVPSGMAHNVNNAQALKSAAVAFRTTGNASLAQLSLTRVRKLDAHCGLPTGMFVGDEIIPADASGSHHPSRGIELCGVVEAMYSYAVMFSTFGSASTLDKAERIAFNALPATWASPTGGDMWAHQYLQAVNQYSAHLDHPHIWTHDGDDSERYGLEPNYGCCTANFNQGWPKLANNALYTTGDGGLAVGVLAPVSATLPSTILGGGSISLTTEYPFGDEVHITAMAASKPFPVYVRVPGWAGGEGGAAELIVESAGQPPLPLDGKNGSLVLVGMAPVVSGRDTSPPSSSSSLPSAPLRATLRLKPKVRLERWSPGGFSVHRGPLMFSLPVEPNFTVAAHHWGTDTMSNDYDVYNHSRWAYALVVGADDPTASLSFVRSGAIPAAAAPFNHSGWTIGVKATVRPLPGWGIVTNAADVPPPSPACANASACGEAMEVTLVPHGATDLRIGMFPLA
jgi:hypothetical protein